MQITYKAEIDPSTDLIIDVYKTRRSNKSLLDHQRIARMYAHSNLIVTAWHKLKLVGISRSLTDFCHCCYLSDLAVRSEYKSSSVGRRLIEMNKEIVGEGPNLVHLSAPSAIGWYPKAGFDKVEYGFVIERRKE